MLEAYLFLIAALGVPFGLQLLLLRLSRRRLRFLRWLVLLAVIPWLVLAWLCWDTGGWFWELGVMFYLFLALMDLVGWGLAWGVWKLLERRKRYEPADPAV